MRPRDLRLAPGPEYLPARHFHQQVRSACLFIVQCGRTTAASGLGIGASRFGDWPPSRGFMLPGGNGRPVELGSPAFREFSRNRRVTTAPLAVAFRAACFGDVTQGE